MLSPIKCRVALRGLPLAEHDLPDIDLRPHQHAGSYHILAMISAATLQQMHEQRDLEDSRSTHRCRYLDGLMSLREPLRGVCTTSNNTRDSETLWRH